jgi:hypothetical protein
MSVRIQECKDQESEPPKKGNVFESGGVFIFLGGGGMRGEQLQLKPRALSAC